jgi:hypothetical protein
LAAAYVAATNSFDLERLFATFCVKLRPPKAETALARRYEAVVQCEEVGSGPLQILATLNSLPREDRTMLVHATSPVTSSREQLEGDPARLNAPMERS